MCMIRLADVYNKYCDVGSGMLLCMYVCMSYQSFSHKGNEIENTWMPQRRRVTSARHAYRQGT